MSLQLDLVGAPVTRETLGDFLIEPTYVRVFLLLVLDQLIFSLLI